MVQQALDDDFSVVIGLTSTSEAAQKRAEEEGSLENLCALKQTAETVLEAGKKAMGAAGKGGASTGYAPDGGGSGDERDCAIRALQVLARGPIGAVERKAVEQRHAVIWAARRRGNSRVAPRHRRDRKQAREHGAFESSARPSAFAALTR